jgi:hypothetical protein
LTAVGFETLLLGYYLVFFIFLVCDLVACLAACALAFGAVAPGAADSAANELKLREVAKAAATRANNIFFICISSSGQVEQQDTGN